MLADKTLLTMTLAATFASGTFVGYAAHRDRGAGAPPTDPAVICAPQLAKLETRGYDDAEMKEARQIYADYLDGYDYWIREFLDTHRANTDIVDKKLDKNLEALEARHKARTGAK